MGIDRLVPGIATQIGMKEAGVQSSRALVIALVFLAPSAPSVEGVAPASHALSIRLFPDSERTGHPVVLTLPGELYSQPQRITFQLPSDPEAYATPEQVVQLVMAADRAGDVEAAAKAYAPELRERVRNAERKRAERQSRAVQAGPPPIVDIVGRVHLGSYVGVLRRLDRGQGRTITHLTPPLRSHEGTWMICNDLNDNAYWTLLRDVIREGWMPEVTTADRTATLSTMVPLGRPLRTTASDGPDLAILHEGRNYFPGLQLSREAPRSAGGDHFVQALELVLAEYATGESKRIASIIHPSERGEVMEFVQQSAAAIATTMATIKKASLKESVLYGEYALAVLVYTTALGDQEDCLVLKRDKDRWFVTDALRDDPLVTFLRGRHYTFPKIAPIIWD